MGWFSSGLGEKTWCAMVRINIFLLRKKLLILFFIVFFICSSPQAHASFSDEDQDESGFFEIDQRNNHWCFIDPWGNPFFSTGVCAVNSNSGYAPDRGNPEARNR